MSWRTITDGVAGLVRNAGLDPLPVRRDFRGYTPAKARGDFAAGLNVALLAFPQGMAYAAIAGLPLQYGLYTSAVASMLGPLFAGSRFIALGPTNATSVLLFTAFLGLGLTAEEKVTWLPLLLCMVGVFLAAGALFRVATLLQFVSRTVVTGYITAAAFYIIFNQARKALGIEFEIPRGTTFFGLVRLTLENLGQTHGPALLVSVVTGATFLLLGRFERLRRLPVVALVLVLMSLFAAALPGGWAIKTLAAVDARQWALTFPTFDYVMASQLAGTALIIAFLSVLEGASIGKSLAARAGERIDVNQEMFGMGVANLGCALYGGMPASGSLTRSQLAFDSGARTALANIFCGLLCALGAFTLGPLIRFIPEAALAILVIAIGCSLVNRRVIQVVVKTTRGDAVVFATTFLAALLIRLDVGIILGAGTSILLFLQKAARPELVEYSFNKEGDLTEVEPATARSDPEVSIVHVEGNLFFGAAEIFRDQLRRTCEDPNLKVLVLKVRNALHLDATAALALEELVQVMRDNDSTLLISEIRKPVLRVFRDSGLIEVIGRENIFIDDPTNTTLATAKALRRAQEVIGTGAAKVSIYTSG